MQASGSGGIGSGLKPRKRGRVSSLEPTPEPGTGRAHEAWFLNAYSTVGELRDMRRFPGPDLLEWTGETRQAAAARGAQGKKRRRTDDLTSAREKRTHAT